MVARPATSISDTSASRTAGAAPATRQRLHGLRGPLEGRAELRLRGPRHVLRRDPTAGQLMCFPDQEQIAADPVRARDRGVRPGSLFPRIKSTSPGASSRPCATSAANCAKLLFGNGVINLSCSRTTAPLGLPPHPRGRQRFRPGRRRPRWIRLRRLFRPAERCRGNDLGSDLSGQVLVLQYRVCPPVGLPSDSRGQREARVVRWHRSRPRSLPRRHHEQPHGDRVRL